MAGWLLPDRLDGSVMSIMPLLAKHEPRKCSSSANPFDFGVCECLRRSHAAGQNLVSDCAQALGEHGISASGWAKSLIAGVLLDCISRQAFRQLLCLDDITILLLAICRVPNDLAKTFGAKWRNTCW